ncbi:hypothetical protein ACFL2T_04615 [Elusimicrobiota bacterium]
MKKNPIEFVDYVLLWRPFPIECIRNDNGFPSQWRFGYFLAA